MVLSGNSYGKLSQKFVVEISYPISRNIIQNELNEEESRIYAQTLIIEKYIDKNLKYPRILKEYHKIILKNFFSRLNENQYDLVFFKKENEIIKNDNIYFQYSAHIKSKEDFNNLNFWDSVNNLIKKGKIDPLLSLELFVSYKKYISLIHTTQLWKKTYNGGIIKIISNKLLDNPNSMKFIDKQFTSDELSSNLEEIVMLFDMAPLNLDICIKVFDILKTKNYKSLAYKILTSCKTFHSKKVNDNDIIFLTNDINKLEQLNINLDKNSLINKIIYYRGYLPIKLFKNDNVVELDNIDKLIHNFEKKPNLYYLKKIRDKFKSMDLDLIIKYLTNQIGVSQNETYKF